MKTKETHFTNNSAFSKDLKYAVRCYFEENNISEKGDWRMVFKTALLLTVTLALYLLPYLASLTYGEYLWCNGGVGFLFALVGFCVMHDAGHKSSWEDDSWNSFFSRSLDWMGCSSYFWNQKHNIEHHTYTNQRRDDDLETNGVFRFAPWQKRRWYHSFQILYAIPIYATLYFQWVFINDVRKYSTLKIGDKVIPPMNTKEKTIFWSGKAGHIIFFVILPIVFFGWYQALVGYLVFSGVTGLLISSVFQPAHVQRKCLSKESHERDWMKHQIATTADFATGNRLVTFLLGGLNFQGVHHLFPKVSHVHYPKIQSIIKEVCKKHGVPYHEYPTFAGALVDHAKHLVIMGVTN